MAIEKNEHGLFETTIDEHVYEFTKWGAGESLECLLDISAMIGKPLSRLGAQAVSRGVRSALKQEVGGDALTLVFEGIFEQLAQNRREVLALIRKLGSHKVMRDGKRVQFDEDYAMELPHLMKVVQAALEVQYGNFFAAVAHLQPPARPQPPSASL